MPENKWWDDFFINGWDKIQDSSKTPEATESETAFVEEIAKEKGYKKILDAPCGDGRIAIELTRKGYDLTGIDFNPNVIEKAKERSSGLNINWSIGDMRELAYDAEFDMALCMFGSFGYFDDEGNKRYVEAAAKSLRKGGGFIIDTHILESLMPIFTPKSFNKMDDAIVLEEREFDLDKGTVEADWTFIKDNEQVKRHSSIRIYCYKELTALLSGCGFGNFKPYGSFEGEGFTVGSRRLILFSEKLN